MSRCDARRLWAKGQVLDYLCRNRRCVNPDHPLVCVCPEPDADPRRNWGECSKCRRKPLALMGVQS